MFVCKGKKKSTISCTPMEVRSEKAKLQPDNFQRWPTLQQYFDTLDTSVRDIIKTETD